MSCNNCSSKINNNPEATLCEECYKKACKRCQRQCSHEKTVHTKLNIHICHDCFMDDMDFCIVRYCTNFRVRPSLLCPIH